MLLSWTIRIIGGDKLASLNTAVPRVHLLSLCLFYRLTVGEDVLQEAWN